jgi:hypothetical protein
LKSERGEIERCHEDIEEPDGVLGPDVLVKHLAWRPRRAHFITEGAARL